MISLELKPEEMISFYRKTSGKKIEKNRKKIKQKSITVNEIRSPEINVLLTRFNDL